MVTQNTAIKKVTANSITGFITQFNSSVVDAAFNYATYNSSNYPKFGATAYGYTTPISIPSGQLAAASKTYLSNSDTRITASTLWSSMLSVTRTLVKIRLFYSYWYYNNNGTQGLVTSMSGRAVFNTAYPAVPSGGSWARSGATSLTLSPTCTINADERATASNANAAITNCFNAWVSVCRDANPLTYQFYTCHTSCHSSCHSACHDSRGRR